LTYITILWETPSPKVIMGDDAQTPADLLQGTLELLILKTLATGEKHGYEIAEWIHVASAEALSVEEGALYPALHRLEIRGLLSAEWDISANNRRAKYYRLTATGRKRLKETRESWRRTSVAINRVLEAM
jgi:PadR family transcriptional regulator PadR